MKSSTLVRTVGVELPEDKQASDDVRPGAVDYLVSVPVWNWRLKEGR
jgi:hypothetical protein